MSYLVRIYWGALAVVVMLLAWVSFERNVAAAAAEQARSNRPCTCKGNK